MLKIFKSRKGISLTELAVVFVVISLIVSANLSFIQKQIYNSRISQTHHKLAIIEQELASYVSIYNKLPLPNKILPDKINNNNLVGSVPIEKLKLPKDMSFDGFGNLFIYAISSDFAEKPLEQIDHGNIEIINKTDQAVYVLMSRGANSNTPLKYEQMEPNFAFNDIVVYKLKWQLVREAGGLISDKSCLKAREIWQSDDKYEKICGKNSNCPNYLFLLSQAINNWCLNELK